MRIIAGRAKGRILKVPRGTPTRPATDLVRGAIFSMLASLGGRRERVLDLYSGSGALGIEALSRGAVGVDFVDREPKCRAVIKENLRNAGFAEQAHVYGGNVRRALSRLDEEYDLVLIDPPYADTSIGETITKLADSRLLHPEAVVVVTHSPRLPLQDGYGSLRMFKERRHGDSVVAFYRKGEEA